MDVRLPFQSVDAVYLFIFSFPSVHLLLSVDAAHLFMDAWSPFLSVDALNRLCETIGQSWRVISRTACALCYTVQLAMS